MSNIGEATVFVEGQKATIDRGDGVRFQVGEGDEEVTVTFRHGELRVHSHAWSKSLAAVGESGNVLRLKVIDR